MMRDRSLCRPAVALLIAGLLTAGCASAPPTPSPTASGLTVPPTDTPAAAVAPTPTETATGSPTASPTVAGATSTPASPTPSASQQPTLQGVWRSSRLTRSQIEAALTSRGIDPVTAAELAGEHAFVDYIVYELSVSADTWTEKDVPDGLPWAGWTGPYEMSDAATVVAHNLHPVCDITYSLTFSGPDLDISVLHDTCGEHDRLAQIALYESAPFHRVEGPGAPAAALFASPSAAPPSSSGTSRRRLSLRPAGSVAGTRLGYVEYLPPGYSGGGPSPLLVALHGSGQSGAGDAASLERLFDLGIPPLIRNDAWPDNRPFVVLAPQHYERVPDVCITPAEIADFIAFALGHYDVDPRRVYLTGLSCGAIGSWNYLAAGGAHTVAAAVLLAGGGYGPIDQGGCALGAVPIWAFHGVLDDVIPVRYDVNSIARLQACTDPPPTDARLTLYPSAGHDSWTRTYDLSAGYDVYDWLLGYSR